MLRFRTILALAFLPALAFCVTLAVSLTAFAQDVLPTPNTGLPIPGTDGSVTGIAKLVLELVQAKNYWALGSLAMLLIIGGVRKWTPEASKVGTWLHSKVGGWTLNIVGSLAAAFFTAGVAGVTFNANTIIGLIISGLGVAFGSAGLLEAWRDLRNTPPVGPAVGAGTAAAADPKKTLGA